MSYTSYTLDQLTAEIANTLSDPAYVYWSKEEIQFSINEFLRSWSAGTSYWRERGQFSIDPSSPSHPYYDLSVQLPTLRARSVTLDALVREIQGHFLEPISGLAGTGMTSQFNISSITQAIIRGRNRFCLDAQFPISITPNLPISPPPDGRVSLPEQTMFVHRAGFFAGDPAMGAIFRDLIRSDAFAADAYNWSWPLSPVTIPTSYSVAETPPIQLQMIPPPIGSGVLELISVNSSQFPAFDATTTLGVPDDFTPAIKYAAMADLMDVDSESSNPFLADYCDKRYANALEAAKLQRSILRVQVNRLPLQLASLCSLNRGRPSWRNRLGNPNLAADLYDILTFSPVPNSTAFGVQVDVVRSAPILVNGPDFIQLGTEELSTLLDYCQHYLSFKSGGSEFQQTFSLYDGFETAISRRNSMLNAQTRYLTELFNQPARELEMTPNLLETSS